MERFLIKDYYSQKSYTTKNLKYALSFKYLSPGSSDFFQEKLRKGATGRACGC